MSAAPTAKRLSRRSLERQGMTPEEELELLIEEQRRDDTYFVDRREGEISLDAPAPIQGDHSTIGDLLYEDEDGEIRFAGALPHSASPIGNAEQHGTLYGYRRKGCRCAPCKAANAKHLREYRARKQAES